MPPGLAPAIAAAGSVIGAGAGIAGALSGGGGQEQSGFTLPPEYERDLLSAFQTNLQQLEQDYTKSNQVTDNFLARLNTLDAMVRNAMPSGQAVKQLTEVNYNLARSLGLSSQEMVDQGYITEGDKTQLQTLEQERATTQARLAELEKTGYTDPNLENQVRDQRRQLEQDLARQGVGPAQRSLALQQFDQQAAGARFTRAEELRSGQYQRTMGASQLGYQQGLGGLQAGAALRQQGFGMAQQGYAATQQGMNQYLGSVQGLGQITQAGYGAQQEQLKTQQGLRGERLGGFQEVGKFLISDRTKQDLASGKLSYNPQYFKGSDAYKSKATGLAETPRPETQRQAGFMPTLSDEKLKNYPYKMGGADSQTAWENEMKIRGFR